MAGNGKVLWQPAKNGFRTSQMTAESKNSVQNTEL